MENASKALLIAAAVLVVILIIAFGMRIFNSTGDTTAQVDDLSSSQQMQSHNAQLTGYLGNRTGTNLRSLLVAVNNINTRSSQHDVTIVCNIPDAIQNAGTAVPAAQTQVSATYTTGTAWVENRTYTVTASYDAAGYIYAITIV